MMSIMSIVVVLAAPTSAVVAERAEAMGHKLTPEIAERIANATAKEAERHDLPPTLVLALIENESAYDHRAKSGAKCVGLTQLAPATAKEVAKTIGLKRWSLTNIEDNVRIGIWYFAYLIDRYHGHIKKALTAYNVGIGRFEKRGRKVTNYATNVLSRKKDMEN